MNPLEGTTTEAEAILELSKMAEHNSRNIIRDANSPVPRLFIPSGETYDIKEFEQDLPNPSRLKGTVKLHTSLDLVNFVRHYKGDREVAIYLNADDNSATAVFDHHSDKLPGWGAFTARIDFRLDPRFERWLALNNKWNEQQTFAEFLEDNSAYIAQPDASTMIDIISDLKVNKTVNMASTKVLRNGDIRLQWDETSTETKTVPSEFHLLLPVYKNQRTVFAVTARLRYRFNDRQLKWLFTINEMENLLLEAWQRETLAIRDAENVCPVWEGKAPA